MSQHHFVPFCCNTTVSINVDLKPQTCISTLATRHLAIGHCDLQDLDQLRAPMKDVLGGLAEQLRELQRYKARFGELSDEDEDEKRGVRGHGH